MPFKYGNTNDCVEEKRSSWTQLETHRRAKKALRNGFSRLSQSLCYRRSAGMRSRVRSLAVNHFDDVNKVVRWDKMRLESLTVIAVQWDVTGWIDWLGQIGAVSNVKSNQLILSDNEMRLLHWTAESEADDFWFRSCTLCTMLSNLISTPELIAVNQARSNRSLESLFPLLATHKHH